MEAVQFLESLEKGSFLLVDDNAHLGVMAVDYFTIDYDNHVEIWTTNSICFDSYDIELGDLNFIVGGGLHKLLWENGIK